ncbi:hypothetical protein [Janthinobacterium sp.]|uniref:hypothetical protein n=1 Tax=Janthinobacterium sp. TaxID=1871054 RepID=UPI00262007FA|nr:hypothetical protein [Janthinobacterium sp.]
MKNKELINGTVEAWENGELGREIDHAAPVAIELEQQIDDALGMQMISIRLPKELIEEYKMIAQVHKLGYQPLMRDALKRFAEAELKKLAVQYANEKAAKEPPKKQPDTARGAAEPSRSSTRAKHIEKKAA